MREQPPEPKTPTHFLGVPLFWVAISGLASAVTMPLRYGEGLYGVGRSGFFATLVIFAYAALAPCPPLVAYGLLFIAVALIKRPAAWLRHAYGNRQSSAYEGRPLPCLVGIPEGFAKQVLEPGMVTLVGWYFQASNPALGCFFLAGAVATAVKTLFTTVIQASRDLAASDLRIRMELDARRRAKRGW